MADNDAMVEVTFQCPRWLRDAFVKDFSAQTRQGQDMPAAMLLWVLGKPGWRELLRNSIANAAGLDASQCDQMRQAIKETVNDRDRISLSTLSSFVKSQQ